MTEEFGGKRDSKFLLFVLSEGYTEPSYVLVPTITSNKEMGFPELTTHHTLTDQWITFLYFS
jgi:hypothetical protein